MADSKGDKRALDAEQIMLREDASNCCRAIADGLRQGTLEVRHGDDRIAVSLPGEVEIEVRARSGKDAQSVSFEISWDEDD